MKHKINALLVVFALIGLAGCESGCGTLNKDGVYKGDKVLYDADLMLTTSYDVIHQFVTFEEANRAALAGTPAIKAAADSLRDKAPAAFKSAYAARDTYVASKGKEVASAFQTALDVIRSLAVEATKQMAAQIK